MKFTQTLAIILCIIMAWSCSNAKKEQQEGLLVLGTNEGILIKWNAITKLSAGKPVSENLGLDLKGVKEEHIADTFLISFNYGDSSAIDLDINVDNTKNTAIFSINSNGLQSEKGSDYVGLFFEEFNGYKQGIASYLFGNWESWTKPVKVTDIKNTLPEKILFFLFQYNDGSYGAMMPLGGNGYNATLGSQNQAFGARSVSYKNGFMANQVPLMAVAFGENPYETIKNLYESGMAAMGKTDGLRKNKTYPEIFESIGWCSWNALGEDVSEKKLMDAVATFSDNDFPLPFMLIDDGWLSINQEKQLTSFEFDKEKFPNGFKTSIQRLKDTHGIKDIGVWHTMNGYWSGINKASFSETTQYTLMPYWDKESVHDSTLSGKTYYLPDALSKNGQSFYDAWYGYLKDQGISFVKVDQQSVIKRIAKGQTNGNNSLPFWSIAEHLEANLQGAIAKHFNGTVVNCQDMATEAVYNFTSSAIGRNSDDFFPERTAYFSLEVEKGNAAAHVLMNVHNSLWYSNMVWPDFDMFQSHHRDAEYHAISRAISGGPIYLTDTPGEQNFDILRQLTLNNGKLLRPDVPALPTEDCLFQINDNRLFKSFSKVGDTGVLGVWNTDDADEVSGTISPSDVNGLEDGNYVVYDYFSKSVAVQQVSDSIPLTLKRKGYKLYGVVPLKNDIALIGLINKYISAKAIKSQHIKSDAVEVTLHEGGTFGAFLPTKPKEIMVNGKSIDDESWSFANNLFIIDIDSDTAVTINIKL